MKVTDSDTFSKMIAFMRSQKIELVAAVQEFTDPASGENYMFFPVAWNDSKA